MFSKTKRQLLLTILSLSATINLVGCGGADIADKGNAVTKQGTIDVETMTVGIPEASLQKAVFSFAMDDNPISHTGEKNQYMARNKTKDGATMLAQCKYGKCFRIERLYQAQPISKEDAIESMKKMLPADAPPQSKVDDTQMNDSKNKTPIEIYYFGDDYYGLLKYTSKADKLVGSLSVDKTSVLKEGEKPAGASTSTESKP